MILTESILLQFKNHLLAEEKSTATVEKYMRDVSVFRIWTGGKSVDKMTVLAYKAGLVETYAPASVNSVLSSLNSFFSFCERNDLGVKMLKIQKQIFCDKEKELSKAEYGRLLEAARQKKNRRLELLMQTICASGIRVSELCAVTVEAVRQKKAVIRCKGKMRTVFLPKALCKMLADYIKDEKIKSGPVFVTKNGKPLDRSTIWKMMKALCKDADVDKEKVFPHNLRHLFARTYYSIQKDIVRLADILGHTSINTTRIYTMETGEIHSKQIQRLGLLRI